MNTTLYANQADQKSGPSKRKLLIMTVVYALILAGVLVVLSGHLDWIMAWAFAVMMGVTTAIVVVAAPADREFMEERTRIKDDVKSWDKPLGIILSFGPFAVMIVAGLDMRYGWSPQVATAIQIGALVVVALGQLIYAWTLASNKFFARFVRIQKERGHTVVTSGPYQYIRHPGYASGMTVLLATAIALDSLWALVPAGLILMLGILRTALEDKVLQNELPGYKDYAQRVRYRLLPGVW